MANAVVAAASARLDGMEQTARTTLTIVQTKTVATVNAKMESTRTRACAMQVGEVLIAKTLAAAQPVPTTEHAKTLLL